MEEFSEYRDKHERIASSPSFKAGYMEGYLHGAFASSPRLSARELNLQGFDEEDMDYKDFQKILLPEEIRCGYQKWAKVEPKEWLDEMDDDGLIFEKLIEEEDRWYLIHGVVE